MTTEATQQYIKSLGNIDVTSLTKEQLEEAVRHGYLLDQRPSDVHPLDVFLSSEANKLSQRAYDEWDRRTWSAFVDENPEIVVGSNTL